MIRKYLIFLGFLMFFTFVRFQTEIFNFSGEKLFLHFHQNSLAITVLEQVRKKNYYTYFLLGRLYFVENKIPQSIENYNHSISLNPSNKEAYYGRGLSYGFYSKYFLGEAEEDFKKYIEIDNQEFEFSGKHAYGAWAGYNDLAWIYFLKGDFDKAETVSRQGLAISPSNPWLSNMLGATLLEQLKCEEAKDYLEHAKELMDMIDAQQFGEAYSGDDPRVLESSRLRMKSTIEQNIALCKSFPQSR